MIKQTENRIAERFEPGASVRYWMYDNMPQLNTLKLAIGDRIRWRNRNDETDECRGTLLDYTYVSKDKVDIKLGLKPDRNATFQVVAFYDEIENFGQ